MDCAWLILEPRGRTSHTLERCVPPSGQTCKKCKCSVENYWLFPTISYSTSRYKNIRYSLHTCWSIWSWSRFPKIACSDTEISLPWNSWKTQLPSPCKACAHQPWPRSTDWTTPSPWCRQSQTDWQWGRRSRTMKPKSWQCNLTKGGVVNSVYWVLKV